MENMQTLIGWIIIIFGVLQIILFFKVWVMTDDVKAIKHNITNDVDGSFNTAQKEIMLGNLDKAFDIYNKCYVNEIITLHEETRTAGMDSKPAKDTYEIKYKEKCRLYEKELSKLGSNYSIDFSRFDCFDKADKIIGKG